MNEPAFASPPDEWKNRMAFREVFLLCAPRGGAGALRRFGCYMYETVLESGPPETPTPRIRDQVRAVAEDLGFSGQVLAGLPAEAKGAGFTAEETALAMKAESWAREVTELVRAIEAAVGNAGRDR